MKKLISILGMLALLGGLWSCSELDDWVVNNSNQEEEEMMDVHVRLHGLPSDIGTRISVGSEENVVQDLYMLCFSDATGFIGVVQAEFTSEGAMTNPERIDHGDINSKDGGEDDETEVAGRVSNRTNCIHFVANRGWTADEIAAINGKRGQMENVVMHSQEVMTSLSAENPSANTNTNRIVYWGYHKEPTAQLMRYWLNALDENGEQVLKLDDNGNPIPILDENNNPVYKTDENGNFVLDNNGNKIPLYQSQAKDLYMITDRAKVVLGTVTDPNTTNGDDPSYKIKKIEWAINNGHPKGFIAPFNNSNLSNPFEGYYTGTEDATVVGNTPLTECTDGNRFVVTENDFVTVYDNFQKVANKQICLFEDRNPERDPVTIIMKVTYTGGEEKYHSLMLIDDKFDPYPILRSHTYTINIGLLPMRIGEDNLPDAIATKAYSNNQMIGVDPSVNQVSDGINTLYLPETTIVYHTPINGGTVSIPFEYRGTNASSMTANDFKATWNEMDDGFTTDNSTTISVSYSYDSEDGVGKGNVSFPLGTIGNVMKKGEMRLLDTKYGLSRFLNLYSILKFNIENPKLTRVAGESRTINGVGTNGGNGTANTYVLEFDITGDYPQYLFPLTIKFATKTLNAFSDNDPNAEHGTFSAAIESTTGLKELVTGNLANTGWYEDADDWGYWYTYQVLSYKDMPTKENGKFHFTIYMDDVNGARTTQSQVVGLFLKIVGFGDPIPVAVVRSE